MVLSSYLSYCLKILFALLEKIPTLSYCVYNEKQLLLQLQKS